MKYRSHYLMWLIMIGLIGVAVSGYAQTPKPGGTLTVAMLSDTWNLDPIHIQDTTGRRIFYDACIGESLYYWSVSEGKYIPLLATELPSISKDGKIYTIPLRKGIKFHDGTAFDAEDMVYSLNRILNPANNSYIQNKWSEIVEKGEALDPYTFKITLKNPDNAFLPKLAGRDLCPVPKESVEKAGKDYGTKVVVGTGPFKFVSWSQGDRVVLEKNSDYWQKGLPYLDKVIFKIIPEESTAMMQLRLGEIDILENISRKDIKILQKDKKIQIKMIQSVEHEQIYLNTANPPFNDIRVRKALAHAIDRKAIIEGVFEGYAEESFGPYHNWFWTHNPALKQTYPYDPEKAKKLLAEAGYGPGKPLQFELLATNQDMFIDQAVMVQAFMQAVGAKVEVLPLDKSTLFDRVYVRKAYKGKPEMFAAALEDWGSSVVDPEDAADLMFRSNSGSNKCFYNNSEVDKLFDQVNQANTMDEQKKVYYQTEEIITNDVPTVWICNPMDAVGFQSRVKGYSPDPHWRMQLSSTWIEK